MSKRGGKKKQTSNMRIREPRHFEAIHDIKRVQTMPEKKRNRLGKIEIFTEFRQVDSKDLIKAEDKK